MKAKAIGAKTYTAAFYGIEAAEMAPSKMARFAAAVIDVYRNRNNNHNTDNCFTTLTDDPHFCVIRTTIPVAVS